jgi:NADH:ubiquinone reductase (H+-translocating)
MNAVSPRALPAEPGLLSHVGGAGRPRVVIVGAGFGGLTAAKTLASVPVDVTIIDKHNYHLFQPLLYQVATAGLSPAQIAAPIRSILKHQVNATVRFGEVTGIDKAARHVELGEERLGYDWLILATGAHHAYFGHDEWEQFAPGLKKIEDATAIRRRILVTFEEAENMAARDGQRRELNFVVIGGGPTGVEMAGAIAELARTALAHDFRHIDPRQARVILLEAGPRLLPAFPSSLSAVAMKSLAKLGVEVRLGAAVTECNAQGVKIGSESIASHCMIWGAGVAASPAAKWLGAEYDRAGRVKVNPDLTVPGHSEIFVIGDTAVVLGKDGKPVPGVAQAAKQQGAYVARKLRAILSGQPDARPFRYFNAGNLATIGRSSAVADFGWFRASGFAAWVLWCVAHIYFLIGFRNRLSILIEWIWAYITFQRGARLITGPVP